MFLFEYPVDFLLISEHWQTDDEIACVNLPGYLLCSSFCRPKRKHGGVAIYCKQSFNVRKISLCDEFSVSNVFECCGVEIMGSDIVLMSVYHPPSEDNSVFLKQLSNLLDMFINKNKFIIIGGDFNIDFNVSSSMLSDLTNIFSYNNMCRLIYNPTRVTSKTSKCIDNIVVNAVEKVCEANIIKSNLSDHFAQYAKVITNHTFEDNFTFKRFFTDENILNFCQYLQDIDWTELFAINSCNDAFNCFMNIITYYFDLCFPIKKLKIKTHCKQTIKVTPEIKEAKDRVCLFADLSRQYPEFKQLFTAANNEYRKVLSTTSKLQNDEMILNSSNKNKAMWTIINNVSRGAKKSPMSNIEIEDSGKLLDPKQTANSFNDFFISAAKNITTHIPQNTDYEFIESCINNSSKSLFFKAVIPEDILDIIANLKNSNSSGTDEISNFLLKKISPYICLPLTYIINLSLEQGVYPDKLKISNVIPLHKKGDLGLMINYRGISLSPSVSKVFEHCINLQIIHFFTINRMLSQNQHGFTKEKSIDTALSEFVNGIVSALDKSQIALGLFIDFSKAFDCVDHAILLTKLERYGIRGVPHKWFLSYLSERYQRVIVNGAMSDLRAINTGVPQGSVLGPTLFLLYINDMLSYIENPLSIIASYADDTNILIKSNSLSDAETCAVDIFTKLTIWVQKNKLSVNTDKTTCVVFKTVQSNIVSDSSITLDTSNIVNYSLESKMLGLTIDCHLKWSSHIQNVCSKLAKNCYALTVTAKQCSQAIVRQLYFGCFHNTIKYGIVHWGLSYEAQKVFVLQKRAVRVIANIKYGESCRGAFKSQSILTLASLYIYEVVCFVYKNKRNFGDNKINHHYNTRKKDYMLTPKHDTALFQKSLLFNGCKLFNILPDHIKNMSNIFKFKRAVKALLVDKTCYTVEEFMSVF